MCHTGALVWDVNGRKEFACVERGNRGTLCTFSAQFAVKLKNTLKVNSIICLSKINGTDDHQESTNGTHHNYIIPITLQHTI